MAKKFIQSSLIASLKNSLEQKSKSEFLKYYELIKISGAPIESISSSLLQAFYTWKALDKSIIDDLRQRIKYGITSDLENLTQLLRLSDLVDFTMTPYILESLNAHLKTLHPLEMDQRQMIYILKALESAAYYNKGVLDFVSYSILKSNLPPGRLGQELICILMRYFSNANIEDEEIWNLLNLVLSSERYNNISFANKVSIVYSFCLTDKLEIPQNVLKDFLNTQFQETQVNPYEFLQIFNYLKCFKGIQILGHQAEKFQVSVPVQNFLSGASYFQEQVEDALKCCNKVFESEYKIIQNGSLFVADFFIPPNYLIEVQGPIHYLRPINSELQKSVRKRLFLESLGYKVFSIPYFAWPTGRSDQITYINSLLL